MLLNTAKCDSLLERLFVNEYDECLLYCNDLSNPNAAEWLETESVHLLKAAELLHKYEHTPWRTLVLPRSAPSYRAAIVKLPPENPDKNASEALNRAADILDFMLNGTGI